MRLDKWLWAARFFKTRPLASAAVSAGKVRLNSQRVKPARDLRLGDRLQITRAGFTYDVEVLALAERRASASLAAGLYLESEASMQTRAQQAEQQKLAALSTPHTSGRPDKQQRRHIIRFKQER